MCTNIYIFWWIIVSDNHTISSYFICMYISHVSTLKYQQRVSLSSVTIWFFSDVFGFRVKSDQTFGERRVMWVFFWSLEWREKCLKKTQKKRKNASARRRHLLDYLLSQSLFFWFCENWKKVPNTLCMLGRVLFSTSTSRRTHQSSHQRIRNPTFKWFDILIAQNGDFALDVSFCNASKYRAFPKKRPSDLSGKTTIEDTKFVKD